MAYEPSPASVQVQPSNPAGTVSGTLVMAGLGVAGAGGGWTITPQVTGRILILCTGILNDATTAMTLTTQIKFGTGSAPVAGAAVTGTSAGSSCVFITLTGVTQVPFSLSAIVSGLAVPSVTAGRQTGTLVPVWIDLGFGVSAANSFTITNLSCSAFEF